MARRPLRENKQSPSVSLAEVLMSLDLGKLFGVKEGGWKLSLAGLTTQSSIVVLKPRTAGRGVFLHFNETLHDISEY